MTKVETMLTKKIEEFLDDARFDPHSWNAAIRRSSAGQKLCQLPRRSFVAVTAYFETLPTAISHEQDGYARCALVVLLCRCADKLKIKKPPETTKYGEDAVWLTWAKQKAEALTK